MKNSKKVVRARVAMIGHSKYDFYKAAYAAVVVAGFGALVLGIYLWDKASEAERKAGRHFGSASKPAAMKVANVVKPVSNLRFG